MSTKTLKYAFYRSKKHLRVHVVSRLRKVDENEKISYQVVNIGTFSLYKNKESVNPAVFDDKLTPSERIEFREFLYSINFGKSYFNEEADFFGRDILRLPQGFVDATLDAAITAEANGLEFNPHQIIVEALLSKIKALEHDLSVSLGQRLDILVKHGYHDDSLIVD